MLDFATEPPAYRRVDIPALNTAVGRLVPSTNPHAVFQNLADLMVPSVCDLVGVDIFMNGGLASWLEDPPLDAERPRSLVPAGVRAVVADASVSANASASAVDAHTGFTLTAHVFSLPAEDDGWTGDREYVAALRCSWVGTYRPTPDDVAVIKLAGRSAAGAVHQSQQAELVRAQQDRIESLSARLRDINLP